MSQQLPELLDMMKSGVHFGHTTSRWHPKMEEYIFAVRQGVHIIDLEKTQQKLSEALEFIQSQAAQGKSILWIATKKQARDIVKKYAQETNSPYVVDKWLGGTFTNFDTIQKLITKLEKLEGERDGGVLEKYTKKEQLEFSREIERLDRLVGGIRTMKHLPGAVFMIDVKEDKTPRLESNKKKVPVVGIVDTNVNPLVIDYPIPGNDDAIRAIELYCQTVAAAIASGKAQFEKDQQAAAKVAPKKVVKAPAKKSDK